MQTRNNISISAAGENVRAARYENYKKNKPDQEIKSVSAAGFQKQFDPIAYRKQQAAKQIGKILSDALGREKATDSQVQDLKDKAGEYKNKAAAEQQLIDRNTAKIEESRIQYEVGLDSEEQKDLEFLQEYDRKRYYMQNISDEDKARAAELEEKGLTEYQQQARQLSAHNLEFERQRDDSRRRASAIEENVRSIEIDRLGSQGILDAVSNAEALEKAANKEILGMLIQEGKEQIDEDMEEEKLEQLEAKEKKKEEEERLEKAKEKREETEELTEQMAEAAVEMQPEPQAAGKQDLAQREINLILQKSALLPEDIKGLKIDDTIF